MSNLLPTIVTGNLNKKSFDRTHWYSLTNKELVDFTLVSKALQAALGLMCPNGQMQVPKWSYLYQIINTDIRDIARDKNQLIHIKKSHKTK